MNKEKEETFIKRRLNRKSVVAFLALVGFFILLRFPYGDLMRFAVERAGERAGVTITQSDVSYRFPLGIELEDVRIEGARGRQHFSSPLLETLRAGLNVTSLFSDKKVLSFYLIKGGEGRGTLLFDNKEISLEIDMKKLDMEGLSFGNNAFVDGGSISLSGTISIGHDPQKGGGQLSLSAENLILRGLSPLVPTLNVERLDANVEKSGETVSLKEMDALIEGVKLKGDGEVHLGKKLGGSRISIKAKLDVSGSKGGAMEGIVGMAKGMTGGKDNFNLGFSGTIDRPSVTIDGKKLF